MNDIALLRRISLAAMLVAVVTGTVSLYMLFTKPNSDKVLFAISVVALIIGIILDRRAGKLEDRNAK
jgi:uncharacterized membrane protein